MATFPHREDELSTCPYNPSHRVPEQRLQQHIVKCSKNRLNPLLVDCPFNSLHRMSEHELSQHLVVCEDSRQVIRQMEECLNVTPTTDRPVVSGCDDWSCEDDKSTGNGYVIPGHREEDNECKPFAIKSHIEIQCLKPGERKKYYKDLVQMTKTKQMAQNSSEDNERQSEDVIPRPSTSSAVGGIGRGVVPSTNRMQIDRTLGIAHRRNGREVNNK